MCCCYGAQLIFFFATIVWPVYIHILATISTISNRQGQPSKDGIDPAFIIGSLIGNNSSICADYKAEQRMLRSMGGILLGN